MESWPKLMMMIKKSEQKICFFFVEKIYFENLSVENFPQNQKPLAKNKYFAKGFLDFGGNFRRSNCLIFFLHEKMLGGNQLSNTLNYKRIGANRRILQSWEVQKSWRKLNVFFKTSKLFFSMKKSTEKNESLRIHFSRFRSDLISIFNLTLGEINFAFL